MVSTYNLAGLWIGFGVGRIFHVIYPSTTKHLGVLWSVDKLPRLLAFKLVELVDLSLSLECPVIRSFHSLILGFRYVDTYGQLFRNHYSENVVVVVVRCKLVSFDIDRRNGQS